MQESIFIGIIIISLVLIILTAAFLYAFYSYYKTKSEAQRKLFAAILNAQEDERKRMSQDIHDSLGGLLTTAKLYASELISEKLSTENREDNIQKLNELLSLAKTEARNASNALMPEDLKKYGLSGAINIIPSRFDSSELSFEIENQCPENISEKAQIHLYRIVNEIVNNTVKYANASKVYIDLFEKEGKLVLHIKDNGIGFNYETVRETSKGNGLNNIITRCKLLNGKHLFNIAPEKGTDYIFEFELRNLQD